MNVLNYVRPAYRQQVVVAFEIAVPIAVALAAIGIFIEAEALVCTKCRLSESRTNVVFGSGDPNADLMFVGEGPGQREDELAVEAAREGPSMYSK